MLDNLTTDEQDTILIVIQTEIIQHSKILEQLTEGEPAYIHVSDNLKKLNSCRDKIAKYIIKRRIEGD